MSWRTEYYSQPPVSLWLFFDSGTTYRTLDLLIYLLIYLPLCLNPFRKKKCFRFQQSFLYKAIISIRQSMQTVWERVLTSTLQFKKNICPAYCYKLPVLVLIAIFVKLGKVLNWVLYQWKSQFKHVGFITDAVCIHFTVHFWGRRESNKEYFLNILDKILVILNANSSNNIIHDNVYDAVIMSELLQEFSHSSDECGPVPTGCQPTDRVNGLELGVCL